MDESRDSTLAPEIGETLRVATEKRAALSTARDLRTILTSDPEAFERECSRIIRRTTDKVTKQFWEDVREFARQSEDD